MYFSFPRNLKVYKVFNLFFSYFEEIFCIFIFQHNDELVKTKYEVEINQYLHRKTRVRILFSYHFLFGFNV